MYSVTRNGNPTYNTDSREDARNFINDTLTALQEWGWELERTGLWRATKDGASVSYQIRGAR